MPLLRFVSSTSHQINVMCAEGLLSRLFKYALNSDVQRVDSLLNLAIFHAATACSGATGSTGSYSRSNDPQVQLQGSAPLICRQRLDGLKAGTMTLRNLTI